MRKFLSLAIASSFALAGAANAAVVIDFEQFSNAEQVLASDLPGVADLGVTNTATGPDVLIAFDTDDDDTTPPNETDDPDLLQDIVDGSGGASIGGPDAASFSFDVGADFSQAGKIGIISENDMSGCCGMAGNNLYAPADDSVAGVVTFLFDNLVTFESISFVDTEFVQVDLMTGASLAALSAIATFTVSGLDTSDAVTPNLAARILSTFDGAFNAIRVTFRGSGAVESIVVNEIPIPGAMPLLLSGIAGLAFASRRRKKALR